MTIPTVFFMLAITLAIIAGTILPATGQPAPPGVATECPKLRDLLAQFIQASSGQPEDRGASWKKWHTPAQPWDILLATATDGDSMHANLLLAMQDTLPVAALVSANGKKRYQYVQLHKNICRGWEVRARALSAAGSIDWVGLQQGEHRLVVGSDREPTIPRLLVMPLKNTSCLILTMNQYGDAFEHMLQYDTRHRSLSACANFALRPSAVQYLFLKGADDTWLEFSYVQGHPEPVGIAEHRQIPGRLSAVLMDLNKDGRMDVLAEVSADEKHIQFRNTDAPALLPKDAKRVAAVKNELAAQATEAHRIWLELQGVWLQLSPLGVVLPELFKL